MIPRLPPYAKVRWDELACVTDDWENGDPFKETMWYHMLNLLSPHFRGQEYPDVFELIEKHSGPKGVAAGSAPSLDNWFGETPN